MRSKHWHGLRIAAWAVVCGAGLAACGGDGGDEATPDRGGTVALTTANRDTAARATATSVMALGASGAIPFAADGSAAALGVPGQASAGAARSGLAAWVPARVLDAMWQAAASGQGVAARSASMRPLAVTEFPPEACLISGTVTVKFDDRNNDNQLNAGDVWTFVFDQCRDDSDEVLNGSVTAAFSTLDSGTLLSFSADLGFGQFSAAATDGQNAMTLNGNAVLAFAQTSSTAETLKMTANGDLVAAVRTDLPFTDTLTLRSGFYSESNYDLSAGLTTTTVSGTLHSAALGGSVVVSTVTPIVQSDDDSNPRSGAVRALGSSGEVRLTAVSTSQVRIELDADDNGSFESTTTQSWDWLL